MEKKIDMVKLFAANYRSLHIYKGVKESMDRELRRQGFVAVDTPNGVRFAKIKQLQYTNDAPLGEDSELNLIYPTELAESEDDRIMKEIIAFVEQSIHRCGGTPIPREQEDKWLAWLEKQGEHANFLSKIQVDDKVTRNEDGVLVNLSQLNRVAKKRGEQKLTDKVEQKFKVGNWYQCTNDFFGKGVTFDKNTAYYCAEEGCLKNEYGCHIAIVKDLYDNFKLWTIQDAKDGDVLATKIGYPFIYDKNRYNNGLAYYYAGLDVNKELTLKSPHQMLAHFGELRSVSPATKEQRDLLFQKMHEAGYEWDAEKKELKKIDQNFILNEIQAKQITPEESLGISSEDYNKVVDECIFREQTPAWSEEDERKLNRIYLILGQAADTHAFSTTCRLIGDKECVELQDFIKALKERYTWKPSEEQMGALRIAIGDEQGSDCCNILRSLLEDLKSL